MLSHPFVKMRRKDGAPTSSLCAMKKPAVVSELLVFLFLF
jgi:hypothetical protein